MPDFVAPLFVVIVGPATDLLLRGRDKLQRDEGPLIAEFTLSPGACPGVAFSVMLEIHTIEWIHIPVVSEFRRRSPRSLVAVRGFDLQAKLRLDETAITVLGGHAPDEINGQYYPDGWDGLGYGLFNAAD